MIVDLLWSSTVGYPNDSLAFCTLHIGIEVGLLCFRP